MLTESVWRISSTLMKTMKRKVRSFSSLLLVWFSSVASVHAHGGAPSALAIVAADANGPRVVLLNEGLAEVRGDRWSFLCPSLWGDRNTSAGKVPLALSVDGRSSWIIGADDLYLARGGTLEPQGRPDLSSNHVVALEESEMALVGLRLKEGGTELVRIGATEEPPLWGSSEYWSALAARADRLHLARLVNERELAFITLDLRGALVSEVRVTLDHMLARVDLSPTSSGLFATVYDGNAGYTLGLVTDGGWQSVLESETALYGPQASPGGQLWISSNGQLLRASDASARTFEPVGPTGQVTCLEQWGGRPYACVGSELYWLEDDGLGERFFQLAGLSGPPPGLASAAAEEACGFQWILFRNDLERSGLSPRDWTEAEPPTMPTAGAGTSGAPATDAGPPATDAGLPPTAAPPPPEPRPSGGCSAAGRLDSQATGLAALLGAALALASQRRRRCASRSAAVRART